MCWLLEREADRRSLAIIVNSLSAKGLKKEDRQDLIPRLGTLYEQGISDRLSRAEDLSAITSIIDQHPILSYRFQHPENGLEQRLAAEEVDDCKVVFEFPANYAVYYAWTRLKEQEGRNIVWIGECVGMRRKEHVSEYIPLW
jgi:V-type H+-transporting ATPase subunit d